jgi:hypothetical protein
MPIAHILAGKAFEELEIAQKVETAELRADMAGQKAALMAAKLRELGLDPNNM